MKVAVASEGPDLESRVASRFARVGYFLLVDSASGTFSVRDNSGYSRTPHTAGMQAAGALVGLNVGAVITGSIGPKAFATLEAGNVDVYTVASQTVAEAVEQLEAGKLQPAREANMKDHWTPESV